MMGETCNAILQHISAHQTCHHQGVFQAVIVKPSNGPLYVHHHHHVQEGLGLIPVPCILKMKLVSPSLPQSSYVSSSFWFIL